MVMLFVVLLTILLWPLTAFAEEQRCTELATNCICSEPFNMTALPKTSDAWNPNDSTSKQCTVEDAFPNHPVSAGPGTNDLTIGSDSIVLNSAPNRTAGFSRYIRRSDGHEGSWNIGHGIAVSSSFVRVAARVYVYFSPNAQFNSTFGTCFNSKMTQHDKDQKIDLQNGNWHMYNYNTPANWSPSFDCCGEGNPLVNAGPTPAQMRGKLWRWEFIMTKRSGPGWRLQMYQRNVTDNGAEFLVVDSYASGPEQANRMAAVPSSLMSKINLNFHRASTNFSDCLGYYAVTHYMYAGWTTDSGQRIGAAYEVEGGTGGGPTDNPVGPPAIPSNLTVTFLTEE